ncbi:ABC transporter substrate-binding protein [Paenibacillus sp. N1-5-1-14]|nr:ABC transporter substrate-binding protein [Paenibacillus radicibacter]MCR8642734.1 ABC transporter substrate-binding protein [Paenibacillus radicibacter]
MSMVLTACSGSSGTGASASPNAGGSSSPSTGSTGGGSTKQSTIIVGRGGDTSSLDVSITTDGESAKVAQQITETLLRYKEGTTEVEPNLADSYEVAADGLSYTFKLHPGIKFSDGTDFNAEAVAFNFMRWHDPNSPYKFAEDSFDYYNDMFGSKDNRVIKEIKAVDSLTVQFILNKPQAPFLQNIAMTFFGIASPTAIKEKKEKYKENPVGTGPFIFKEWKRNDSITLEKNANYWRKGLPKADKLIIRSIPDNSARLSALRSGELDLMEDVNPDDAKTVEGDATLQKILRPSFNIGYLGFNQKKKPFDNPKVRVALNYAVDKNALIKAFFGGMAIPAVNTMPPSLLGYNKDIKDYPYDIEKAKQLLAEAGYPNGFDRELVFYAMPVPRPYMPNAKKVAETLQAEFAKLGIKTKIESPDWATYLQDLKKGEKDDIFIIGWTGDNGDPDNFLYPLLDKDAIGSNNYAFYSSDPLHEVLQKAQSNPDQKQRADLYMKAQEIIKADAPWVPLVHSTPLLAAKKGLKGYAPSPTGSETYMNIVIE